jgi:2-hydroxycyclohexanecarboxyl-CoA dehydrogenase
VNNILDLRGRVALVTGAGQGVGAEVARYFAAHNCGVVVVNDFYLDRAEAIVEEIVRSGGQAVALQCDVGNYAEVSDAFSRAEQAAGPIDILVNNAGNAGPAHPIAVRRPFWQSEPDDWQPWLATSLSGVLNCSRAVVPAMIERKRGRIITVISDAGRVGDASLAVYAAAKAGAAGFMRSLAQGVGQFGITVNCVSLAAIRTTSTEEIVKDEDVVRKMLRRYPIRRLGEPSDAAALILFLASDAASWITGQTYPVNGGFSFTL